MGYCFAVLHSMACVMLGKGLHSPHKALQTVKKSVKKSKISLQSLYGLHMYSEIKTTAA